MRRSARIRSLVPLLLVTATAELGARLLRPRSPEVQSTPVDARSYFSAAEIERGARFARPQIALALAREAAQLAALGWLVRRGDRRPRRAASDAAVARGALSGAGLSVALTLAGLPLRAIARRRAIGVGLVTQSWSGWAVDLGKALTIESAFASACAAALVAVSRRHPRHWWLPVSAGSVLAGAGIAALAPVLLDPVFNEFTALPEGGLRSDVLELARAAGTRVDGVYSVDASRRTSAANAYVRGLGPTKRVVLFDTMLERYTREEVRVVVAHELAHVRNRDVIRGIGYAALVAPALSFGVQRLGEDLTGVADVSRTLPALSLAAALLAAPVGLFGNRLSRAMERRADAFSLELSREPDAFVSFERQAALENVADLDPPRWATALLATHPPTAERIGIALAYQRRATVG